MNLKIKLSSDLIGASASTLCTIHCLATPFIFFASTCTKSCCATAPTWWISIDYFFLFISLLAVYISTKNTSKIWMKPLLWILWITLFLIILIEYNYSVQLSDYFKNFSALSLASFHIYNLKFCQCTNEECYVK